MEGRKSDPMEGILVVTVLAIFAFVYVFYFHFSLITTPWLWSVQFNILIADFFNLTSKENIREIQAWIAEIPSNYVTYEQMQYVNDKIGDNVKYLYPFLIGLIIFYINRKHTRKKHKLYDLEFLIEQESKVWSHCIWLAKNNPHKTKENPIREHPIRWAKKHKILKLQEGNYILNHEKVNSLLAEQLTTLITKKEDLLNESLAYKMLLLICLLRLDKHAKSPVLAHKEGRMLSGLKYILKIPPLVTEDDWNFYYARHLVLEEPLRKKRNQAFEEQVNHTLKKLLESDHAKDIIRRHAYTETFLIKAIESARRYGILASAVYPYLQPLDNRVFFILSDSGFNSFSIDHAGIFSHYKAEELAGRRLEVKYIKGVQVEKVLVQRGLFES